MKKILLGIVLIIFILSCKFKANYDEYIGFWETKKTSGIEVLEIRKEGKSYIYKIYSIKKPMASLMKDWKEAENVKITEKGSGTLIPKNGVLFPDYDRELSGVDEMMRFCLKDGKLYDVDGYNMKKSSGIFKGVSYMKLDGDAVSKIEKKYIFKNSKLY